MLLRESDDDMPAHEASPASDEDMFTTHVCIRHSK